MLGDSALASAVCAELRSYKLARRAPIDGLDASKVGQQRAGGLGFP